MTKDPSPTQRVTAQMTSESDAQTKRLVTKLQSEFQGPDRKSVTPAVAQEVIRANWSDPMWRQQESTRLGEVPFVQQAMKAFGLDPANLKDFQPAPESPVMQASQGLPEPPAPNEIPSLPPTSPMYGAT